MDKTFDVITEAYRRSINECGCGCGAPAGQHEEYSLEEPIDMAPPTETFEFNIPSPSQDSSDVSSNDQPDEEGAMAMNQFETIQNAVKRLEAHITKPTDQLPAWVQSKIALAADYIDTVADFMDGEDAASNRTK